MSMLKESDKLALVCTGSICDDPSIPLLTKEYFQGTYGLAAVYDSHTYTPMSATKRAEALLAYLLDDDITAIWSLRGGEGSADIIPFLESNRQAIKCAKPKLLLGFSDFTPLLIYFYQHYGWPTIHAPGARQFHENTVDAQSEAMIFDWLLNQSHDINIPLQPLNLAAHQLQKIKAPVLGGNLSLVHIGINDIWEAKLQNSILLLEEINEKPHKIARTLKYFQRIGMLDHVKAIILAGCNFVDPAMNKSSIDSMLRMLHRFSQDCAFPVLYTEHVSHLQFNYPVPLYKDSLLTLGHNASLQFT
jgi:muramoyltetrapeptide carboxypeptidase